MLLTRRKEASPSGGMRVAWPMAISTVVAVKLAVKPVNMPFRGTMANAPLPTANNTNSNTRQSLSKSLRARNNRTLRYIVVASNIFTLTLDHLAIKLGAQQGVNQVGGFLELLDTLDHRLPFTRQLAEQVELLLHQRLHGCPQRGKILQICI